MFLKQTPTSRGKFLQIVESYYDNGVSRQRVIEKVGYLNDLKDHYDDPIHFFKEKAKQMTKEKKNSQSEEFTIDLSLTMNLNENASLNVGYGILKRIYLELKLDIFWKQIASNYKIDFDLEAIFRLLTLSRILFPDSKKATFENRSIYFEPFNFTLMDVYRALPIFAKEENNLQAWLFQQSKDSYSRDLSHAFFDCTNYYFEIENNDTDLIDEEGNILVKNYRKRGPEKNHRPDPIIEMGLLMDGSGIPLAYELFPGNESEKIHLRPILNRSRTEFGFQRTVVVADRGLNTSDNMYFLAGKNKQDENHRDGYIYGQSVRGGEQEFKDWVIDQDGYTQTKIQDNGETIVFTHKSRIYPRTIYITREMSDGKTRKQKITIDQKQLVYYSKRYAKRQKIARNNMIERAKDLIAHPKKYDKVPSLGTAGYVRNLSFDKTTGEIIGKALELDEEKIKEEEKYDGYYSIVTSELEMSDVELRKVYRGLSKIEDTFKVTKSELEARPVYVWTKESIEAHFMTCFTALVIIRLLGKRLQEQYSVEKMIQSLQKYNCVNIGSNKYMFTYYDAILRDCSETFQIELDKKYRTRRDIRHLLKY
ncbi:MAG: IS1634 family transposase [Erysipelotrichia bacterium]|nr:IS1634 family transposase [Erysipelotrichia bacterium]NCC55170.1 IS1634 family transposase [Erysipelotrichia bacterium]